MPLLAMCPSLGLHTQRNPVERARKSPLPRCILAPLRPNKTRQFCSLQHGLIVISYTCSLERGLGSDGLL